jgi:hypothetical protein
MKLKSARPATPLGPGLPDTIALPFYAYTYATHQERKIDLSESRELSLKWCEMNDHQSIHPRLLRPTPYFKLRVDSLFHSSCVPPSSIIIDPCSTTHHILPVFWKFRAPIQWDKTTKVIFVLFCWLDSFTGGLLLVVLYMWTQAHPNRLSGAENTFLLFDSSWIFFLAELLVVLTNLLVCSLLYYIYSCMPQQVERCWEHIFLFDSSWIFFLAELGSFVGGFDSFVDEVCVLNISRSHHQNNLSNASRWMPAPGVAVMRFLGLWGDHSGGSLVLFVS